MTNDRSNAALALGASLVFAGLAVPTAADPWTPRELPPLRAASFELGSQRVLAFFTPVDGQCKATLMIGETRGEEVLAAGSRIVMRVEPGRSATFDGRDGQSLRLDCRPGALALRASQVRTLASNELED